MPKSQILIFSLLSFISGIFLSSFFSVPPLIIWELFFLGIFFGLIFWKEERIFLFGIILIFLAFGIWRGSGEDVKLFQNSFFQSLVVQKIFSPLKERLKELIYQNFSPPHSSLLGAFLLGEKKKISSIWKEKLNRAGVRHIVAISGIHIVILGAILNWLFLILRIERAKIFYFTLFLIWFFIFLTGAQSSALRAGIMGSIFLLGQKIARPTGGGRVLLLSGALMLAISPSKIRWDIGFQLSFLATLGLIYLFPLLEKGLSKIEAFKILKLNQLLAITLSAQIFVLPFLIYYFGYFSPISLFANLLILPFLPYLMAGGFLFLISGLIWESLAFFSSLFLWPILEVLIFLIDFFSKISPSQFPFQIPWIFLLFYYLTLFLLIQEFSKKQSFKLATSFRDQHFT